MDPRARKLVRKGLEVADAVALVEAGIDSPAKIRRAKVAEIEAIPGIGEAKRKAIKERFENGRKS